MSEQSQQFMYISILQRVVLWNHLFLDSFHDYLLSRNSNKCLSFINIIFAYNVHNTLKLIYDFRLCILPACTQPRWLPVCCHSLANVGFLHYVWLSDIETPIYGVSYFISLLPFEWHILSGQLLDHGAARREPVTLDP